MYNVLVRILTKKDRTVPSPVTTHESINDVGAKIDKTLILMDQSSDNRCPIIFYKYLDIQYVPIVA
jgi:hypothetical protein